MCTGIKSWNSLLKIARYIEPLKSLGSVFIFICCYIRNVYLSNRLSVWPSIRQLCLGKMCFSRLIFKVDGWFFVWIFSIYQLAGSKLLPWSVLVHQWQSGCNRHVNVICINMWCTYKDLYLSIHEFFYF